MVKVRTAVIPAAGLGTRFLPASKAVPKELVPLVDRPSIQWVVEEAVGAGCTRVVMVVGRGKEAIADHFDRAPELEAALEASGKTELLAEVRRLADLADLVLVRQGEPRGLGHAVSVARAAVGDEPFAVLLPDDVFSPRLTILADLVESTEASGRSTIALMRIAPRAWPPSTAGGTPTWWRSRRWPMLPPTWPSWAGTSLPQPCSTPSRALVRAPSVSSS
jgi:UTP--glucose-1-phosphate uridylyltransferase